MSATLISALAALAGALIGGLASLGSTWLAHAVQSSARSRDRDRTRREALFSDFIDEASRLYGDALSHEKNDVLDMVRLYALVARIRLISSRPIVASAERTLDAIIDGYLSPNRTLQDLRLLMSEGKMNFLVEFSEACRVELDADGAGRRVAGAASRGGGTARARRSRSLAPAGSRSNLPPAKGNETMSDAVGPGDLVLCVNAAPNHVTGQPVPLVAGETYRVVEVMEFACPCGRSDALLDVGIDFAWCQSRFRLLPKPKFEARPRRVSAPKEKQRVR